MTLLVSYSGLNGLILGVTGGLGLYNSDIYNLDIYDPNTYNLLI